ncbi:MAG: baseplate [Hoeflea sp.]|uniref:baseplate n=1 Tax=Hoeflea sp. TaxID=1940281 RepID=UPI000C0DF897|nr:baseplate [Hoeflea sp.]PHR19301.1 MAG: baseplate [Hoeflea sp.]
MENRFAIEFAHWSLRVGRADPRTGVRPEFYGLIVTAVDDLSQSIGNLILTPLGSVPTQPLKGCDLYPFIDRNPAEAIPNLTQAIWDALEIWEKRIVVQDVDVSEIAYGHFQTRVFWRPSESVLDDLRITEVHFASANDNSDHVRVA